MLAQPGQMIRRYRPLRIAIAAPPPPTVSITNVTGYEGATVTVTGTGFGDEAGTVEMYDILAEEWEEAEQQSWSATEAVVDNIVNPWCLLRLTNVYESSDTYEVC